MRRTRIVAGLKHLFLLASLAFAFTSCFKDKPTSEFSKVAGSWLIDKVIIEDFDSLGVLQETTEFEERGFIMLTYNEGSLAENGFSYSFNTDQPAFNNSSLIEVAIEGCNRWDVSVNAKHINFGYVDENTQFSTLLIVLSIEKLNGKQMHWTKINRNQNGSILRKETYQLKRSN